MNEYSKHFENVYLKIDDNCYYGYEGTLFYSREYDIRRCKTSDVVITNRSVLSSLDKDNIDSLLNCTFKPKSQDPIHVVPDCKYNIADIRNNYKIKRDFDSGVCNVFSPLDCSYCSLWIDYSVIIPKEKHVVFVRDCSNEFNAYTYAKTKFPNLEIGDCIFYSVHDILATKKLSYYFPLLLGTAQKPCISYKDLEFNTNELTLDVLLLVKKCGDVSYYEPDAEKNFLIQLAVLNQHNWRDYPRTIANVFDTIHSFNCIKEEVFYRSSKYPKYVKEMILLSRSINKPYSEKDFNLTVDFYSMLLNIKEDTMFVDTAKLLAKLNESGITFSDFNGAFNLTTRISKKKYA